MAKARVLVWFEIIGVASGYIPQPLCTPFRNISKDELMFTCNRHQHHDLNLNIDDVGMFRLVTLRYCMSMGSPNLSISDRKAGVCGGGGGEGKGEGEKTFTIDFMGRSATKNPL